VLNSNQGQDTVLDFPLLLRAIVRIVAVVIMPLIQNLEESVSNLGCLTILAEYFCDFPQYLKMRAVIS
jgi:hypothetical protein